ncbi:hypothetical protein RFW18_00725 [Metabacillus idriensis]|uniref:hypothetical protein n=1 Tax=Metabacillus idriensis TaxID=324768 RepID=UPI002813A02D|nr:hypothetical protein [Metabacillus idriensis]MDR0136249.1 hypothetical protein [Metabacillus idriensis]
MFDSRMLPLPFFKLNHSFRIEEQSLAALKLFQETYSFIDLIDEDSRTKAEKVLKSDKQETELVLKTLSSPLALFKVNISRDDDFLYLLLTEQNSRMEALVHQVELHRRRLAETDLQLLAKKEEAEQAYNRIVELSSPFIMLTKKAVLIPLFGSLSQDLISKNTGRLLNLLADSGAEQVFIDFHGVGEITEAGILNLSNLVQEISLMGAAAFFASLTPAQAKEVYRIHSNIHVTYVQNLNTALETYLL